METYRFYRAEGKLRSSHYLRRRALSHPHSVKRMCPLCGEEHTFTLTDEPASQIDVVCEAGHRWEIGLDYFESLPPEKKDYCPGCGKISSFNVVPGSIEYLEQVTTN